MTACQIKSRLALIFTVKQFLQAEHSLSIPEEWLHRSPRTEAVLRAKGHGHEYLYGLDFSLLSHLIIYIFCCFKIQKVKGADQSDRSKTTSKEHLMCSNQRARRFEVGSICLMVAGR